MPKTTKRPWEDRQYPKDLKEPIDRDQIWKESVKLATAEHDLNDDGVHTRFDKLIADEELRKIRLLLEYYLLDPNDPDAWQLLALKLARHHVPGMKHKKPSSAGRSPRWQGDEGWRLVDAVVTWIANNKKTKEEILVSDALREVAKSNPGWARMEEETLRSRYEDAKRYHRHRLGWRRCFLPTK